MFSSEQKFSINGPSKEELLNALEFACRLSGWKPKSYLVHEGQIVFYWYDLKKDDVQVVPEFYSLETLVNIVWDLLKAGTSKFEAETKSDDIDGTIKVGWQISMPNYKTPDWSYAFLIIKHDWIYYAK